jgi:hypothetical protein
MKLAKGYLRNIVSIGAYAFMNPHILTFVPDGASAMTKAFYGMSKAITLNRLASGVASVFEGLRPSVNNNSITPLTRSQTLAIEKAVESNPMTQSQEAFESLTKAFGEYGIGKQDFSGDGGLNAIKQVIRGGTEKLSDVIHGYKFTKFAQEVKEAATKIAEKVTEKAS